MNPPAVSQLRARSIQALVEIVARQQQHLEKLQELVQQQNAAIETLIAQLRRMLTPLPPLSAKMIITFRHCPSCGAMKPLEDFYRRRDPRNAELRHRQCKDCLAQKGQLRREQRQRQGRSSVDL